MQYKSLNEIINPEKFIIPDLEAFLEYLKQNKPYDPRISRIEAEIKRRKELK